MSKISDYVNNVFYAFPQTSELLRLKADMIDNMEEKYENLLSQGKNENEALGQLISEFGSVDEIAAQLNLQPNSTQEPACQYEPFDDPKLMEDFSAFMDLRTKIIIGGVMGIIIGVAAMMLLIYLQVSPYIAVSVLLLCVACATGGFIWVGMTEDRYKAALNVKDVDSLKRADEDDPISGLIMCLATAIFFLYGFAGHWETSWLAFPIGGALCGIVSNLRKAAK